MSEEKSNLIQITGLWLNESKSGAKYFTGYMGNAKVLIFKNNHKETDKHPDYILYVAPNERREAQSDEAAEDFAF